MIRALAPLAFACFFALSTGATQASDVTINTAAGQATVPFAPAKTVAFDIAAIDTLDAIGVMPTGIVNRLYVDYLGKIEGQAAIVGTLFEPDFEAINAMQPDLIILGPRTAASAEALQRFAPTIDMSIWGDDFLQQTMGRLTAYGQIFNRTDTADRLKSEFQDLIDAARQAVKGKGKALIVMTNGPKISAYGEDSRFGWLHRELGIAVATDGITSSRHGEAISFEYIQQVNPDWLIVIDRAAAIGQVGDNASQTLDNALVADTTAWKQDQIIYLDSAKAYIASGGIQATGDIIRTITDAFSK